MRQPRKAAGSTGIVSTIVNSRIVLYSFSLLAVTAATSGLTLAMYEPGTTGIQGASQVIRPAAPITPEPAPAPAPTPGAAPALTATGHDGPVALGNLRVHNTHDTRTTVAAQRHHANRPAAPAPRPAAQAKPATPPPAAKPAPAKPAPAKPAPKPTTPPAPVTPAPRPTFSLTLLPADATYELGEDAETGKTVFFMEMPFAVQRQTGHTAMLQASARLLSQPSVTGQGACDAIFGDKGGLAIMALPEDAAPGMYVCELSVTDGTTTRVALYDFTVPTETDEPEEEPGQPVTTP